MKENKSKYFDLESLKEKLEREKDSLFELMENDYNEPTKKFLLKSYNDFIPKRQLDFMKKCIEEDFTITIKSKKGEIECEVGHNNTYSLAVGLYILEQTIKKHKIPQPIVDIVKDMCENKFEHVYTIKE